MDIEKTDDGVRHQEYGVTEETRPIVARVVQLVNRNAPGDRELAIAELGSAFRVFEVPA